MSVGFELRSARETRHLTLSDISQSTKIKLALLMDLENNDVSRWPKQRVYRHGHLRAYAHAVGLDPVLLAERFDDEFGDPAPVAFHDPPKRQVAPTWFRIVGNTMLVASLVVLIGLTIRMLPPLSQTGDVSSSGAQLSPSGEGIGAAATAPVPPAESSTDSAVSTEEVPPADIEGEIRIISVPPGAHVTVNGIGRGQTPLRVRYLPLGSYAIRLIHPGFKIRQAHVTLKSDQPARTVRLVLQGQPTLAQATLTTSSDSR